MITKNRIIGALVAALAWQTVVEWSHIRAHETNRKLLEKAWATADYLAASMDREKTPFTEFDQIALAEINSK